MSRATAVLLAAAALFASGCAQPSPLSTAAASGEARFARETLALLLQGDVTAVRARMAPRVARQATPEALAAMLAERPAGEPTDSRLVNVNQFTAEGVRRADFTYEYAYPDGYLLALVVVDSSGATPVVEGLHLKRLADSLARVNAFRLGGRTPRHYAVLAACLLVPGLVVSALVLCARTPALRLQWLWLAFIAVGVGRLSLNWTTGALSLRPSVQFLGAGAWAPGPYAPWSLSFSLPIGAIAFLALRKRLASRGGDGSVPE